ncbi:MAG: polyketide cyclase [Xenophilus sp.]
MSDQETEEPTQELVLEYELDAPPEKVWRAMTIPAFREKWLPSDALADAEPVASKRNEEVQYRIRDDAPPFLESVVTFQVIPHAVGGTLLKVIHRLTDARIQSHPPDAANDDAPYLMHAA